MGVCRAFAVMRVVMRVVMRAVMRAVPSSLCPSNAIAGRITQVTAVTADSSFGGAATSAWGDDP